MENLISTSADHQATLGYLTIESERHDKFRLFVREFCHTFKTKIGQPELVDPSRREVLDLMERNPRISLYTPEGLPCGLLSMDREGGDDYYRFSSPTVKKEKASARSDKSTRDSSTVKGLISVVKRNSEAPTTASVLDTIQGGIVDALNSIRYRHRTPKIDVEPEIVLELVKQYIGETSNILALDTDVRNAYTNYMTRLAESNEAMSGYERFMNGFKAIAVYQKDSAHKPLYIISDVSCVDDKRIHSNMSVVRSLSQDERVAADAMMIRTYMQGMPNYSSTDNELNVRHVDRYFEDIDVAVGYSRHDCLWVLIPNRGA